MANRSANPGPAPHETPRFFWQGVLIVLPVVVLAVFALFSLRQDKSLVEHEAREKAQAEADQIADRLWAALDDPGLRAAFQNWKRLRWSPSLPTEPLTPALNPAHLFQVNSSGQLLFPPPIPELPDPRLLNPADLDEAQAARWLAAQSALPDSQTNLAAVMENLRQFIALAPPGAFIVAARFQLGVLLAREHQPEEAAQEFQTLAKSFPESTGESGLPLPPLALLKAAEQSRLITNAGAVSASALLDAACSNAVTAPSSITPHLLRAALPLDSAPSTNFVARWQARWQEHETARALHAAAQPAFAAAVGDAVRQRTDERVRNLPFPVAIPPATALPPRLFWFVMPPGFGTSDAEKEGFHYGPSFWLAARIDSDANGHWFLCRPKFGQLLGTRVMVINNGKTRHTYPADIGDTDTNIVNLARKWALRELTDSDPLLAEVEKQRARLPDYFGLSLELAGRVLVSSNELPAFDYVSGNKGGGHYWKKSDSASAPPLLASARHVEDGVEYLRVGIHLTSPALLYARQQSRTRLFGLLIGASALAAVIGFVSARRAFRRQQQLAEIKSNFVSSVSHELRAPIASVRLMAESLDRGKVAEPAKQREYFRFIVQECRRLGTLIENVLDFARIEQGRKQYEFEPTDLAALIRQTVQLMEPAATEREVTLEFPNPQPSTFNLQPFLDGAALQQALVNLLDNAIKHSPPNTTVAIELAIRPSSFVISVSDSGPGIPTAEHERIFERFYRRGSELRRETQGVGIGLSIVKHIIEAHCGCVRVESEVGKGSRFTIELPLVPVVNRKS